MTTSICAGDGSYNLPPLPPSFCHRKAAQIVRIEVLCSTLRIALVKARMR